MKQALLDTDIFSEILKNRNPQVAEAAHRYRTAFGRLTVSAITVMEIVKGFRKANQTDRLKVFLRNLPLEEVLPFDVPAAESTGQIYADLERTGQSIGRADPMIAGIALHHGLVLVTANTNHFRRICDLGLPAGTRELAGSSGRVVATPASKKGRLEYVQGGPSHF